MEALGRGQRTCSVMRDGCTGPRVRAFRGGHASVRVGACAAGGGDKGVREVSAWDGALSGAGEIVNLVIMYVRLNQIVVDCRDPRSLVRFWAALLGGEPVDRARGWSHVELPGV